MFEYATGQTSLRIGKPSKVILEEMLEAFHIKKEDCIIVGDNLETDIALGVNESVDTILVTTGVHQREDIERLNIKPTMIIDNLKELMKD